MNCKRIRLSWMKKQAWSILAIAAIALTVAAAQAAEPAQDGAADKSKSDAGNKEEKEPTERDKWLSRIEAEIFQRHYDSQKKAHSQNPTAESQKTVDKGPFNGLTLEQFTEENKKARLRRREEANSKSVNGPKTATVILQKGRLKMATDQISAQTGDTIVVQEEIAGIEISLAVKDKTTVEILDIIANQSGGAWLREREGLYKILLKEDYEDEALALASKARKRSTLILQQGRLSMAMTQLEHQSGDCVVVKGDISQKKFSIALKNATTPEFLDSMAAELNGQWRLRRDGVYELSSVTTDWRKLATMTLIDVPIELVAKALESQTGCKIAIDKSLYGKRASMACKGHPIDEVLASMCERYIWELAGNYEDGFAIKPDE